MRRAPQRLAQRPVQRTQLAGDAGGLDSRARTLLRLRHRQDGARIGGGIRPADSLSRDAVALLAGSAGTRTTSVLGRSITARMPSAAVEAGVRACIERWTSPLMRNNSRLHSSEAPRSFALTESPAGLPSTTRLTVSPVVLRSSRLSRPR